MSDIEIKVSIPLDDDGFLRRECPLCVRQFKIRPTEEKLQDLAEKGIQNYLIEENAEPEPEDEDETRQFTCPYCGQQSAADTWWTQEQLAYLQTFAENIATRMLNEQLIRPLKREFGRSSGGLISLSFDAQEMREREPWISPEENDMEVFDLACCSQKIKTQEGLDLDTIHCFYCAFPHELRE